MGCYYITMELPGLKGEGMIFATPDEADLAFSLGVLDLHAKIKVKLPPGQRVKSEDEGGKPGQIVDTTVGRVRFNMMLPKGMDYYNYPLRSAELAMVISDSR